MNRFVLFVFFFCSFGIAFSSEISSQYLEEISQVFLERKFENCFEILDQWEEEQPHLLGTIAGIRSAVYLSMGDLEGCLSLKDKAFSYLKSQGNSEDFLCLIENAYRLAFSSEILQLISSSRTIPIFRLCKEDSQPTSIKLKYWFGVAEIVIGCLAMPFSPAIGTSLVISGMGVAIDASSDAIGNKEEWERRLREKSSLEEEFSKSSSQHNCPYLLV